MTFEELKEKLIQVADDTIKSARDLNIPSAEAFVFEQNVTNLSENKGKVDTRSGVVQGVGIRVAVGKQIGFSTCTGFSKESIQKALKKAHTIAKESPENPLFEGFVGESKTGKEGTFDPEIMTIDSSVLAKHTDMILEDVNFDNQKVIGVSVNLNVDYQGYAVGTTEGCLVGTVTCGYGASATAITMKGNDRKTHSEQVFGRSLQDVSGLGQKAVEKALSQLGSKPFEGTEQLPVVWHPKSAAPFLGVPFLQTLSGALYVEKRNPLGEKLDKQIIHKDFNLVDNGQLSDSSTTVAVDTEGSPVGKTQVIEDGVLKTFLYNKMYGEAVGVGTTGNATRGGMMGGIPFENIPGTSPRQLVIKPVKNDLEKQIAGCDKGIYIEGTPIGLFTANIITGDFSVTSNNAYLIEKGDIAHPLQSISIAGNYYKAFDKVRTIGSDITKSPFPIQSPAITIEDITISG